MPCSCSLFFLVVINPVRYLSFSSILGSFSYSGLSPNRKLLKQDLIKRLFLFSGVNEIPKWRF